MLLTLIRHGQTEWNTLKKVQGQADIPLDEVGKNQAIALQQSFREQLGSYSAIYSSKLQRAFKTATLIRGNLDLTVFPDSRLNSRNLGEFSGKTLEEIKVESPILYNLWKGGKLAFRPPNGESTREMVDKTAEFLNDLRRKYKDGEKVAIVSHRENIGALMTLLTGKLPEKDPLTSLRNCTPYNYTFDKKTVFPIIE